MPPEANPPPESSHPDRDTLTRFRAKRLDAESSSFVEMHLQTCEPCRTLFQSLVGESGVQEKSTLLAPPSDPHFAPLRPEEPHPRLTHPLAPTTPYPPQPYGTKAVPTKIGPYKVLDKLGDGGMGVVYEARHETLGTVYAVKMLHAEAFAGSDALARFHIEGAALARLDHPNIVKVHAAHVCDAGPYLAMELVPGQTLGKKLLYERMSFSEAAEAVRTLAEAVEYAHVKGVVHRDLKPGNVLIGPGNVLKLVDFGLAKIADEGASHLTPADVVMGTPSYMSLEQASGRTRDVDHRADVYGLGAILYEMLTGEAPFVAENKVATIHKVCAFKLEPPSKHRQGIPRDLEAVCLMALGRTPEERYQTAGKLAEDLGHWLNGRTTWARPVGVLGKARRAARRNWKGLAASVLIGGLALGIASMLMAGPGESDESKIDPRAAQLIERRLVTDKRATLVPATGGPQWYRWQNGKGGGRVRLDSDGLFVVTHPRVGLLELAADPTAEHYTLTAQVRHDRSGIGRAGSSGVGLYVGHVVEPCRPENVHLTTGWTIEGVWAPRMGQLGSKESAWLASRLIIDEGQDGFDAQPSQSSCAGPEPAGERSGVWYDLTVKVTPQGVKATWKHVGEPGTPRSVELSDETMREGLTSLNSSRLAELKRPSQFIPRAGLGLIVVNGSAAFRNVELVRK